MFTNAKFNCSRTPSTVEFVAFGELDDNEYKALDVDDLKGVEEDKLDQTLLEEDGLGR